MPLRRHASPHTSCLERPHVPCTDRPSPRRAARSAAVLLLAAAAAGCARGGASDTASRAFDDTGLTGVACMQHQTRQPTSAYRSGPDLNSPRQVRMLRYYTSNGNKDFCDGRPATAVDRAWMRLYVDAGARPDGVARWLAAGS